MASQIGVRVGIGDGLQEVVARHGLTIVAFKVKAQAFSKAFTAHQGLHHADHLGTFFVNGDRVEVVDFQIAVGTNRVGHGPCIFWKLHRAQQAHVFDALDRARRG